MYFFHFKYIDWRLASYLLRFEPNSPIFLTNSDVILWLTTPSQEQKVSFNDDDDTNVVISNDNVYDQADNNV